MKDSKPDSASKKSQFDRYQTTSGEITQKKEKALLFLRQEEREFVATPYKKVVYTVFDLETTGGNPERNAITEICALRVEDEKVVEQFHTLVNPRMPIPPIVRRMTGIDNAMVRNAPKIEEVMPQFVNFIKGSVLVSHNTIGDMKFLRHYSKKVCGNAVDNFYLCTHLLAEKLAKDAPNKSLKGLGQYYGLKATGRMHRADTDALMTLELFLQLTRNFAGQKIETLADAIRFQGDYESGIRLGWAISNSDLAKIPWGPGVVRLYNRMGSLHFASALLNGKRDVKRLLRYDQIPKPLLRAVLSTYNIEFDSSASQFDAALEECSIVGKHKNLIRPSLWHQRSITALNLTHQDGFLEFHMGEISAGAIAAFGPVGDRKEFGHFLAEVVRACGGSAGKKLRVDKSFQPMLMAFFDGRIDEFCAIFEGRNSFVNRFRFLFFRLPFVKQRRVLKAARLLTELWRPANLQNLFARSGIVLVRDQKPDSFQIYRLKHGRLNKGTTYSGRAEDFQVSSEHLFEARNVKKSKGRTKPLNYTEALRINAVLWWLSSAIRNEGRFFSADDSK